MAEAPTMEVRARLSAETSQFQKGFEQARKTTEEFVATSNRLRGAMVGIGVVAGALGAGIIAFSSRALRAAAQVEELDIALQAVGASSGIGYKNLKETSDAMRTLGINAAVAQRTTLKLAQANIDMTKAADLARVAQDLSVVSNIKAEDALERVALAVTTGRTQILRTVGITLGGTQAYDAYAASIGKTASKLTQAERQQAVINAVLKQGARAAGAYAAAMESPAKLLTQFSDVTDDLKVSLGQVILDGFGPLIKETYKTYKVFVDTTNQGGALKDILTALTGVIQKLTIPVANFVANLRDGIVAFNKTEISIKNLGAQLEFILPALAAAGAGFATFAGRDLLRNLPILGSALQQLRVFPVVLITLVATSTQVRAALGKLLEAFRPLLPVLVQIGKIISQVGGFAVAILAKAIEGLAKIVSGTIAFVQKYATAFKILGYTILAVAAGYAALKLQVMAVTAMLWLKNIAIQAVTKSIALFRTGQAMLNATLAFNPIGAVIAALVALVVAFAAAWKNSETFREVMTKVFNTIAKVVGKVIGGYLRAMGNLLIGIGKAIEVHGFLGQAISKVFQFIWETYLTVWIGALKLIKAVIDGFIALMENQGILGQVIETVINFIIKAYLTWVKFVVDVVKKVIETFITLMENNQFLRNVVEEVFNAIIRIIALAITAIVTSLANIIKSIATLVNAFEGLLDVSKAVAKGVIGAFFALGKGIVGIFSKVASGLGDFLDNALTTVKEWVKKVTAPLMKIPIVSQAVSAALGALDSMAAFASDKLGKLGTSITKLFTGTTDESAKSVDAISKVSKSLIDNAKSWGNYKDGAAGVLSDIANKMLDFNMKVVQIGAKDNGAKIVEGLVAGAKKALPTLEKISDGLGEALQVNFGKAVVDTLVKGAKLASEGLGKLITEMEKLKEIKVGEFLVDNLSQKAIEAGNFLVGLAGSIESFTESNFVEKVGDAFEGLVDKLKEGLGFADILKKEQQKFNEMKPEDFNEFAEDLEGNAEAMKRIRQAMADGIKNIKDVIQDLTDAAKDFADSLKETIVNFAGLKGVELPDGFIPKAKSLIENMRMRLDKSQQFATQIAQLQSMGLNADSLKAIIEEGPLKGAQLAASILGGGLDAVQQINELQKQITFTGAAIGQFGSDLAYKDLIANAQNRLATIEGQAFAMRGGVGSQVFVEQGAVQIRVDASMTKTAEEMADVVTEKINAVFATLAKELSAK